MSVGKRRDRVTPNDVVDVLALMPWWICLVLGVAAYFAFHAMMGMRPVVTRVDQMGSALTTGVLAGVAVLLQYLVPLFCIVAAGVSFARRAKRSSLVHSVSTNRAAQALDGMTWQDFELLVGEAFRLQGFKVEERGGLQADGGIDVVLRRDGETFLVQCKHWKSQQVSVQVVRELFGVMASKGAAGGYVVTSGTYTAPARAFASAPQHHTRGRRAVGEDDPPCAGGKRGTGAGRPDGLRGESRLLGARRSREGAVPSLQLGHGDEAGQARTQCRQDVLELQALPRLLWKPFGRRLDRRFERASCRARRLADTAVSDQQENAMPNVFVEPTSDGKYQVEFSDHTKPLGPFATQHDAIQEAKKHGHHPLVARVRHLNDKSKPDQWRSAT